MRLARELGGMTTGEMLDRMSSVELTMWLALYDLEAEEHEFNKQQHELVSSFR